MLFSSPLLLFPALLLTSCSLFLRTHYLLRQDEDAKRRQLLDLCRSLGNALLKFIYARKSSQNVDEADKGLRNSMLSTPSPTTTFPL